MITKLNADIQKLIKQLSTDPAQKEAIQGQIAACKEKIRGLLPPPAGEPQRPRLNAHEVTLTAIAEEFRSLQPLLKCLNVSS